MVKIGMMIGDRYEILEKIGTGGMSDVYKAKCHKLNRLVAIKVLKQEFSENANFVSKFRVEAQAAAGLMHPNIVNVYDVGEENDINYIVMELVEGITLKKYIEKKARLSVKEAVTIAIQIGLGIEAAHNNHIIHRDIKPQNVIISKDGKVKVTDFGIAKAATSNTITSNVMGSVHYTSPEQARGGYSDEKSDIYSLGITLFEMLTGRVPFNGDTTVAIAIKQIQEDMPSPREYVPEIPISVEQIVLKCTQKSADRRYQNMGSLISDLKQTFITPDEDFVKLNETDELGETRKMTEADMESLKKTVRDNNELTGNLPRVDGDEGDEYDNKMDKITTILAIAVGAILCVAVILLIMNAIGSFRLGKKDPNATVPSVSEEQVNQVVMPQVSMMDYTKALGVLEANKLKGKVTWIESSEYEKGIVIKASIQEGLKVDEGAEIVLTVSAGTSTIEVPDVVGFTLNAANQSLMKKGFEVDIQYDFSEVVAEGIILSQNPEGSEKAPEGSVITIVVSKGKASDLIPVPSVLGKTLEEATIILHESGFDLGEVTESYNNIYAEGYVCYQSIDSNIDVSKGTVINLQVSKGNEPETQDTYSFSASILAPQPSEDDQYVTGTEVEISIKTSTGKEILNTKTTSFPQAVNYSNITGSDRGTITLTFDVTKYETITDEDGKQTVVPGETTTHTITREVTFVKE